MGHASFQLNRRELLKLGVAGAGALAIGPSFLRRALAAGPVTVGPGPYGPPQPFDANGIALPAGFESREIARGGSPVPGSGVPYAWHGATDGQATFATLGGDGTPDGGWILVANSEMRVPGVGGVSGIEFASDAAVERAYRVLDGTSFNCAGGPTPWGTWLSCEEYDLGQVWECDPTGSKSGISRPAMGVFKHEAACVDPEREHVYLTEDQPDGCLYRFTPDVYPDLSAGLLEVAKVDAGGGVTWAEVPNPAGGELDPTRDQIPGATPFNGGEGTWYDEGSVYFTTKGDDRVWRLDVEASVLDVLYDPAATGPNAPLSGVDNITVSRSGDIYVCEDGGDLDICLITPQFEISRFLKLDPLLHGAGNELVGVVFDPFGTRMYFGAQRSFAVGDPYDGGGVVYEVRGPFKPPGAEPPQSSAADGLRLHVRRRMRIDRFLRHGLPIELELDEPAGIEATLRVPANARGGHQDGTIARVRPGVALQGRTVLALEPTGGAKRLLEGPESVEARLKVLASQATGDAVERRRVRLRRGTGPGD